MARFFIPVLIDFLGEMRENGINMTISPGDAYIDNLENLKGFDKAVTI